MFAHTHILLVIAQHLELTLAVVMMVKRLFSNFSALCSAVDFVSVVATYNRQIYQVRSLSLFFYFTSSQTVTAIRLVIAPCPIGGRGTNLSSLAKCSTSIYLQTAGPILSKKCFTRRTYAGLPELSLEQGYHKHRWANTDATYSSNVQDGKIDGKIDTILNKQPSTKGNHAFRSQDTVQMPPDRIQTPSKLEPLHTAPSHTAYYGSRMLHEKSKFQNVSRNFRLVLSVWEQNVAPRVINFCFGKDSRDLAKRSTTFFPIRLSTKRCAAQLGETSSNPRHAPTLPDT